MVDLPRLKWRLHILRLQRRWRVHEPSNQTPLSNHNHFPSFIYLVGTSDELQSGFRVVGHLVEDLAGLKWRLRIL